MKKIKIFLASSEELKEERKELADIVSNLNHILSRRDIFVDLVKWEYLDASMGELHKQEEYNAELRECELCIVLYWTRFGKYTKTELDTAYNEQKIGHNPRKLYVYFKESENPSEDLKAFKESFPNDYGHFPLNFGNIDTLKAHFLLQFLDYMSNQLKVNDVIDIRDSQVTVNGQTSVNLTNVPFAGNNEDCKRLVQDIKEAKENLSYLTPENPLYSRIAQKLQGLEEELAQTENNLWKSALWITGRNSTRQSQRLQRAMDLFNSGDNKGAMAVLKEEDIDHDVEHNLHLIELGEEGKIGLKTNIDEYILRIKTLKNDMAEGWREEVLSLHDKILDLSVKVYGDNSLEVANYQVEKAEDLSYLGKFQESLEMNKKALNTRLRILGENHPDVAETYTNIGCEYGKLRCFNDSLEYVSKALQLLLSIFGENHLDVARAYNNVGWAYGHLQEHEKALDYKKRALQMRLNFLDEKHADVAQSYNNVGHSYFKLGEYEKALEYGKKALGIWLSLYGEVNSDVAIAYNNVGHDYSRLGEHKKALEYKNKALRIWLSIFGENHPNVELAYRSVGSEYSKLGDHEAALKYKEKALYIQISIYGESHPEVAQSYNNVGYEYSKLKDLPEALKYRLKALDVAKSINDSNLEATYHNRVGKTYQKMGNTDSAREHFQQAAELFKELSNEEEYKTNLNLCKSLAIEKES